MSRAGRHLCFYSNSPKDPWSKAFLEELGKTPWMKEFQFICVDPSPNRPALPSWLKQVPTLVIEGDPEPVKTDSEVINWLFLRKQKEMPAQPKAPTAALPGQDVESWVGGEMGGFGDAGYSFINSDTSTGGNGGATIPGNFTFLNGSSSPGDRQSQEPLSQAVKSQQGRTKKEMMMDQQFELYKQQRDMGIPQGPRRA